jgi:uncharacterized membrane protein (UPF0127 family)
LNLRSPRALIAIAVVVLVVAYAAYVAFTPPGPVTMPVPSAIFVSGKTFSITYTATTPAERQAGLTNREVTNGTIMLFVFPSAGVYKFWMYDTNTSLDMIWVEASGHVVYVYADALPCYNLMACPTFGPTSQANYVIEAKAGFAQANGIVAGTTIEFEAPTLMQVS